jgi:LPXTG-site transpeptidase (sortase) family protein
MNMNKAFALCLAALLVFLMATGCNKTPEPADPAAMQTPQYSIATPVAFYLPPEDEIHTAAQGVRVIEPVATAPATATDVIPITPETVWESNATVTWNAFTMPEKAAFDDGSIGVLSIPKIGLTVNVYQSDDQMEDMEYGAAHFKCTSAWDGNIGLSSHNWTPSGHGAFFRDLHTLSVGDTLIYRTALGEREYRVTTIRTISDEDWSWLSRTTDNRMTLITCVSDNPSKRLMVQGVQV